MKVVHLIAGELRGGAARGAYWLHQALRKLDVASTVLTTARDNLGDISVIRLTDSALGKLKWALRYRMGQIPLKLYRKRQAVTFSIGIDGVDFTRHPAYREADLVHLHWVNSLVSTRALSKVKKPVVWTLRDMWPFTGGCHQSLECDRFMKECGNCPQLGSTSERDLTRFVLRHKRKSLPEDICIVGISRWISERARQSAVFRSCKVTTISNNVDTELFSPLPKQLARQALGLDNDKKIVLVGALDIDSVYKGFDLFLDAIARLQNENVQIVFFGHAKGEIPVSLGVPITSLGFLSDAISLRLAYSAADVFVAPSRADAFGKTLVEAMSCGTPVVCFDATGPKDIVEHRMSGYKAEPFSSLDLAQGIQWVLDQSSDSHARLCRSARVRAQQRFDSQVIAKAYLALYEDVLRGAQA